MWASLPKILCFGDFSCSCRVSLRIPPSDLAYESVQAVNAARARQKHERTLAGDNLYSLLLARSQSFLAHVALAIGAINPDAGYASFCTLGDPGFGDLRRRQQDGALDRWLDVLHAAVASQSQHVGSSGVNGYHLIA